MARARVNHRLHRRFHHHPYQRFRNTSRTDFITSTTNTTVSCQSHCIFTTVTSAPSVVRRWLFDIRCYHTHRLRKSKLLAGLGVQWTPGYSDPSPATLQLCVGHRCLIFQLSRATRIPISLRRFLLDPNVNCVGVNNKRDSDMLNVNSNHYLCVKGLIDLVDVGSEKRGYPKVVSMEKLAHWELGMEGVRKDQDVGRSNWDAFWLSDDQIEYASVDAFVSFLLGKSLKAWRWNWNNWNNLDYDRNSDSDSDHNGSGDDYDYYADYDHHEDYGDEDDSEESYY